MDLLNFLLEIIDGIFGFVLQFLPESPIIFAQAHPKIKEVMGYVNYFVPVYTMVVLVETWLTAIVSYYIIQILLRWVKAVE